MPFDITRPFHVGYMVENVDTAMAQLSASTGITWHPPQVFPLDIMVGDQRQSFDRRFTYSVEGPVQIELVQGPAGTLFDTSLHGGGQITTVIGPTTWRAISIVLLQAAVS